MGVLAATGVIFAAYYMLPMVQRVFFNELDKEENRKVEDLSRREITILAPMIALMIWIGVYPTPFLQRMEPSVQIILERVEAAAPAGASLTEEDDGTLAGTDFGTRGAVTGETETPAPDAAYTKATVDGTVD